MKRSHQWTATSRLVYTRTGIEVGTLIRSDTFALPPGTNVPALPLCKTAGLSHMHGLRHRYAQTRYQALTGWKAAVSGRSAFNDGHSGRGLGMIAGKG